MGNPVKYTFTVVEHRCDQSDLVVFECVQTDGDFGKVPKSKRFYTDSEAIVPLPAGGRYRHPFSVWLPAKDLQAAFTMARGAIKRETPKIIDNFLKKLKDSGEKQMRARDSKKTRKSNLILPGQQPPSLFPH